MILGIMELPFFAVSVAIAFTHPTAHRGVRPVVLMHMLLDVLLHADGMSQHVRKSLVVPGTELLQLPCLLALIEGHVQSFIDWKACERQQC